MPHSPGTPIYFRPKRSQPRGRGGGPMWELLKSGEVHSTSSSQDFPVNGPSPGRSFEWISRRDGAVALTLKFLSTCYSTRSGDIGVRKTLQSSSGCYIVSCKATCPRPKGLWRFGCLTALHVEGFTQNCFLLLGVLAGAQQGMRE